ncbi:MAG: hypothetical protein JWO95_858 [Verrucomicrobiales bacterium]|nr:hypothetical protein [Verrucomicrobiales bacterium]
MEIDEQPDGHVEQFHVAKELRFMNRKNLFHSLCFHQHAALDRNIEAQRFFASESLVIDHHHLLADTASPRRPNSFSKHHSYMDSIRPGPLSRCTSMAPAIMVSVKPEAFANSGCIRFEQEETKRTENLFSVSSVSSCSISLVSFWDGAKAIGMGMFAQGKSRFRARHATNCR